MSTSALRKLFLAALAFSLLLSPLASAQTAREVAQRAFQSVALVVMEDKNAQPLSLGSGFFVRESVIVTNHHVIQGASQGYVKLVGQTTRYRIGGVVGIDGSHDLVLLTVQGAKAPALALGGGQGIAVGDQVYAVGNPLGLEGTFSQGIVSGIRRLGSDTLLQITAPISPGSSGGPVLNSQGEVIGVAVASFGEGQYLNFAVPVSYVASLVSKMRPAVSLGSAIGSRGIKPFLNQLGGKRSVDGLVVEGFAWEFPGVPSGRYSFSLRNRLSQPVKDTDCLVVFYGKQGNPVDFDHPFCLWEIPPGLAKRVTGSVDGSVEELTNRVEIRVLNFTIIQ